MADNQDMARHGQRNHSKQEQRQYQKAKRLSHDAFSNRVRRRVPHVRQAIQQNKSNGNGGLFQTRGRAKKTRRKKAEADKSKKSKSSPQERGDEEKQGKEERNERET